MKKLFKTLNCESENKTDSSLPVLIAFLNESVEIKQNFI